MKKNNKHQALRQELQAIAQLIGQLAEHLMKAAGLMCSIGGMWMNGIGLSRRTIMIGWRHG